MRKGIIALMCLVLSASVCFGDDAVTPASTTYDSIRGEAVTTIAGGSFYRGTTLIFTNCMTFTDTSGVVTQGLANVTVTVTVGNGTTSTDYTANCYDEGGDGTTNVFWVTFTVPTNITSSMSVQTTLTDANTNIFVYPWKVLQHKATL